MRYPPLMILILTATLTAAPPKGEDWPRFLGPRGDGTSAETGILTEWPKAGLKILWDAPLGQGYAPPVVADSKLYHFDTFKISATLTCRDALTGKELWKAEYPSEYDDYYGYSNGPRCSPLVHDKIVYTYGAEGILFARDAATGKELWTVNAAEKYNVHQNFFGVGSCPVIDGDRLIVAVGGSDGARPDDFAKVKPNGTALVAFDRRSGKELWKGGDELASYSTPTITTVGDKKVGLYFARGGLLGFDPATGKQLFHHAYRSPKLESVNACKPVVHDGDVLLTECYGDGGTLFKLRADGVKEIWTDADKGREKALRCHWNTPIVAGPYVYGSSGRHEEEAELRCVEWATGEVKWSKKGLGRVQLLKADGHFVVLGERGELGLIKINAEKYEPVASWEVPDLDSPTWAAPILSHGVLYVRGKNRLVAIELVPRR